MALPTITELKKKGAKRTKQILANEKGLMKRSLIAQKRLNAFMLNTFVPSLDIDDNGNIKNSTKNLKKIASPVKLKKFIRDNIDKDLAKYYLKSFLGLEKLTGGYFNTLGAKAATSDAIFNRAQISSTSFVNEIFDNTEIQKQLQSTLRNAVTATTSVTEIQTVLSDQIKGVEGKMGLIEGYQYRNGIEEFQTYSRALDEQFSKALKLNYAIYAGTEIKTTRHFCDSRINNVYNRETINSWEDLDFQGKKKNHIMVIDLGGYNCRHDLNWITYELAKRIDKTIEKSKFDK